VDSKLKEIDDKVYAETTEQHKEKHKLDEMVEDVDK
jgi:hypothetical protein